MALLESYAPVRAHSCPRKGLEQNTLFHGGSVVRRIGFTEWSQENQTPTKLRG